MLSSERKYFYFHYLLCWCLKKAKIKTLFFFKLIIYVIDAIFFYKGFLLREK